MKGLQERMAVEALRAGVPSRSAVAEVGTTQDRIIEAFDGALRSANNDAPRRALVLNGQFGSGKSHVLQYLRAQAQAAGFVTSLVAVGPETPPNSPHTLLRALADCSEAPGHVGRATRELTTLQKVHRSDFAEFRLWVDRSPFEERFKALVHLYEEQYADAEFRIRVIEDLAGKKIADGTIKTRLKEIQQASAYYVSGTGVRFENTADQRVRLLARYFRSCGLRGWAVFLDEVEVMGRMTPRQRMSSYLTFGILAAIAESADSAFVPVFAVSAGTSDFLRADREKVEGGVFFPDREVRELALRGLAIFDERLDVLPPTPDEVQGIVYKVGTLYERAYGRPVIEVKLDPLDYARSLRHTIRKCIAYWDMDAYYGDDETEIVSEEVAMDEREVADDLLGSVDEDV